MRGGAPRGPARIRMLVALLPLLLAAGSHAQSPDSARSVTVWEAARAIRSHAFEAQVELYVADRGPEPTPRHRAAAEHIAASVRTYERDLRPETSRHSPEADRAITGALADAAAAASTGDSRGLAAARGRLWGELLHAGHRIVLAALEAGDGERAAEWIALREYRQATKVSLATSEAREAIAAFAAGGGDPTSVRTVVEADLRDAYFFRLRDALRQLEDAAARGFDVRATEWAELAAGYFRIVQADFETKLGSAAAEAAAAGFAELTAAATAAVPAPSTAVQPSRTAIGGHVGDVRARLADYEPVDLSPADLARRSQLLYLFVELVDIEYRDGVRDGRITIETEYREAVTFRDQAQTLFEELRPRISAVDASAADRLEVLLAEMDETMRRLGPRDVIRTNVGEALPLIEATLGEQAVQDASGTFVVVETLLDAVIQQIRQGEWDLAESTRVQAYALFDAGVELRLLALSPGLVAQIDGLFWQGHGGRSGLSPLIASRAAPREAVATRTELAAALDEAERVLGEGAAPGAIVMNSAVIVLREGLEAVLILAALMASLTAAYRRPMVIGAVLAGPASIATWIFAQRVMLSFSRYGERLEAVVSLIAIGVLLVITNWFLHKSYWTDWLAGFHKRKRRLLNAETGQFVGLLLLGFSSVYREGFETVLFLQALVLNTRALTVLQGVLLGLAGVTAIAMAVFWLKKKLPYKKMFIVTGVMIGAVLVAMVGSTIHIMQSVRWMPVTPLTDLQFPYWVGLWFGVFPTWQTLVGQLGAAAFVIGSYYLAERARRRPAERGPASPMEPVPVRRQEMAAGSR